jgi:serine/threonine protein kinase
MDDELNEPEYESLDRLTEAFAAAVRKGERPSIEDYARRHPGLADPIRSLFPALALLESESGEPPATAALVPERLGEYRPVRELGRGGMGIVYEAQQESLDRRVAVKVLPGSVLHDERTRRRFLREARAVARLRHPHIIPIHAVGEQDGVLYYAMDLIDGCGLDQLVTRDGVTETGQARARWVARLGAQAADALGYAHAQGFLHRDIKPANFLLDSDGYLWLADFGLAKSVGEGSLTADVGWLGTLRYTAPECLRGEGGVRSDLYSLGLTLYELLVGQPAYPETDRARLLEQISTTAPRPPRQLDPSVPPDLEAILIKASEREPADRYATASELADDLQRFLDARPVRARRPRPGNQAFRWFRRNIWTMGLVATTALLTLATVFALRLLLPAGLSRTATAPEPRAGTAPLIVKSPATGEAQPAPAKQGQGPPPWAPGWGRLGGGRGPGPRGPSRGPRNP